jgi:hypothetical protein
MGRFALTSVNNGPFSSQALLIASQAPNGKTKNDR